MEAKAITPLSPEKAAMPELKSGAILAPSAAGTAATNMAIRKSKNSANSIPKATSPSPPSALPASSPQNAGRTAPLCDGLQAVLRRVPGTSDGTLVAASVLKK